MQVRETTSDCCKQKEHLLTLSNYIHKCTKINMFAVVLLMIANNGNNLENHNIWLNEEKEHSVKSCLTLDQVGPQLPGL